MSERYIDLHNHSTASDGTDAPSRIPALAAELDLAAVALTDHDTVGGIAEFLAAAKKFPSVEAVPGVEISCEYSGREVHLLGLYVDHESAELGEFLKKQREDRLRRNEEMMRKLNSLGYALSWEDEEFQGNDAANLGRPHFARALVRRCGFPSLAAVFEKVLGHSRPGYVPRRLPSPVPTIEAIHAARGIAVWAHPVYRDRNERAWLNRGLRRMAGWGLDAVEGYYSLFGKNETALVSEVAERYGVALSGGSDYHGSNSTVAMGSGSGGLRVPEELLAGLKNRRDMRRRAD